ETRARQHRGDDVKRRQEHELVARSEGNAGKDLQRLDSEHRERHAGDDADVANERPSVRADAGLLRMPFGALDLALHARDDGTHVAAPETLDPCPEAGPVRPDRRLTAPAAAAAAAPVASPTFAEE